MAEGSFGQGRGALVEQGGATLVDVNSTLQNVVTNLSQVNKTMQNLPFNFGGAALANAANDGAAAALGVAIGQIYRNGSVLMVRVT